LINEGREDQSLPRRRISTIKRFAPSPLREKAGMRGIKKAFSFLIPLTPTLSGKERELSPLT
jgi:hypothetical protein